MTIICRDTEEVIKGTSKRECYDEYLKTKHWRKLRLNIAYKHNNRCQMCCKLIKSGYHIHHLTYKNIGNEKDSDLMFLCESCHNKIHNGKIEKNKTKQKATKQNRVLSIPKNYINSSYYKKRSQFNKIKYLCECFKDRKNITDEERAELIAYMEKIICK